VQAVVILTFVVAGRSQPASSTSAAPASRSTTSALAAKIARFAPVDLAPPVADLPPNEASALAMLVKAATVMDGLFLEQVWAGNPSLLLQLGSDHRAEGHAELQYFLINKGPWSRLDHNQPFLRASVPAKPPQANFYPVDATKEEVESGLPP
jgi:hypothetical protein